MAGILGTVQISGPGGDVGAAISMGMAIRRDQLDTWTAAEPSCVSACVLVFLGGVTRAAFGDIGLHRPFSPEPSDSVDAAQTKFEKVNSLLTSYFSKINIPLRLLDVMNSVPPSEIRLLSPNSDSDQLLLKELYVTGWDPVFADMNATKMAKMSGISKSEYFVRMQRAEIECFAKNAQGRYIVKEPLYCRAEIVTGKR